MQTPGRPGGRASQRRNVGDRRWRRKVLRSTKLRISAHAKQTVGEGKMRRAEGGWAKLWHVWGGPNTMRATRAEAEALCQLCSFQPKYQLLLATDKAVFLCCLSPSLSLSVSLSLSLSHKLRLAEIWKSRFVFMHLLYLMCSQIYFCLLCESGSDCVWHTVALAYICTFVSKLNGDEHTTYICLWESVVRFQKYL